jgi:signal recognition particle subunit SRP54
LLDAHRPAAMEQLAVLGRDLEVPTLPIVAGQKPQQIARRALEAELGGYDVVLWTPPAAPRLTKK